MPEPGYFILGEFTRTLDERSRLSLPAELADAIPAGTEATLVKESPGCLSLWLDGRWQDRITTGVQLVESKLQAERLAGDLAAVQRLGRLLSTRQRPIRIAGKGRLVIPEAFRRFLAVEAGDEVLIVGAAICIEIWQPACWQSHLNENLPDFSRLLEELAQ